MKSKIKIIPGGQLPVKQDPRDACHDMYARQITEIQPGLVEVRLGVAIQPPGGYRIAIYPRSSISRSGWQLANSVGIVDNNYRGEILAVFSAKPMALDECGLDTFLYPDFPYQVQDRVCQMELVTYGSTDWEVVDQLDDTRRGEGGFGSTGNQ
tara:strand:- start:95 stop:553 length:459 start_codon:yes stop_codon:yes gene_type:complete